MTGGAIKLSPQQRAAVKRLCAALDIDVTATRDIIDEIGGPKITRDQIAVFQLRTELSVLGSLVQYELMDAKEDPAVLERDLAQLRRDGIL